MKPRGKFYRINFFIQAQQLRILDETGKQVGLLSKTEALQKARELGVDLVEIAPNAKPPVARLIDFKKFKYLESKKEREEKKKQKHVGIKEVRLSPFIGTHDLETRQIRAREFLKDGNQVKIAVPFRGRQITRKEFGFEVVKRFLAGLNEIKVVRTPHFEGKVLVAQVATDKSSKANTEKANHENADQKNSS